MTGIRHLYDIVQPALRPAVERLALIKEIQIMHMVSAVEGESSVITTGTAGIDLIELIKERQLYFMSMAVKDVRRGLRPRARTRKRG